MKALWYMIRANLLMNMRNRTALFWNLAFPLLFIVLFGFLLSSDSLEFDVGVAGADTNDISRGIVQGLRDTEGFSVKSGSRDEQLDELRDGNRSVVVVFTEAGEPGRLNAQLYWDETDPQTGQIALNAVRQFLSDANAQLTPGDTAIDVSVEAIASNDLRYIDFLVPGILAMSLMNSGIIGLASSFVTYRERGILRRIRATPFPLSSFIAARITSQLVLAVLQAVMLIGAGKLLFDLRINGNMLNVFVVVILGSLAFLTLGFVVAAFSRNQEAADSISNALTFPMLFLGGVFFPLDAAPGWLQPVTRIIPLRYLADALRDLMVRDSSLPDQWLNLLVMLATALVGFTLAVRFFRWESNRV